MRIFLLLIIYIANINVMLAQKITPKAPSTVAVGENFRVQYTIETQDVKDPKIGNIPSQLDLLAGPYISSQSSYQIINGHSSSSSSTTYSYTFNAKKSGTYTISAFSVIIGGKKVSSPTVKIIVSGNNKKTNNTSIRTNDDDDDILQTNNNRITEKDLFIKVSANKKQVHEQEPILLTYKVYTLVGISSLEGKMPDLKGFHTQEIKLPQQKNFKIENINGRPYRTVTWSQYVMYPQMSGTLEIPSITFKGFILLRNSIDPFEDLLNGGANYNEVRKDIIAPALNIRVNPLPTHPDNFSNGVGSFNISAQLDKKEIKTGEPITIRLVISGIGNMKLLKTPKIKFPKDFDAYDVKTTDKTKLTENGIEGNIVYDYLAIPQNVGKYTIPATEFIYYDINTQSYKTIKTQPFEISVLKGNNKKSEILSFEEEGKDIKPIKLGNDVGCKYILYNSPLYWIIISIIAVIFTITFILLKKRYIINIDTDKLKKAKANKVAYKRLKLAQRLMNEHKQDEFYDEVLHALWEYVSDKLSISVTELKKENIADKLRTYNIDENTIDLFIKALDECEFERYAPGDAGGNMNKTYITASKAITTIETVMKSNKISKHKKIILLLLLSILTINVNAITKDEADYTYQTGNFHKAITMYKGLIKTNGASTTLYYNLGNAYYRTDSIAQAILSYERALKLSPNNKNAKSNLNFVRNKTIDKLIPHDNIFLFSWYKSLRDSLNINNWSYVSLTSILFLAICLLLFYFNKKIFVQKISFYFSIIFGTLFIVSNIFVYDQYKRLNNTDNAIIISPSIKMKKSPTINSTDITVLHEGTYVTITDRNIKGWLGIILPDNREGWIINNGIEEI